MTEQPDRLNRAAVQTRFDDSPFISTLGLEVVGLDYESTEITVRMPMAPTLDRTAERAEDAYEFHVFSSHVETLAEQQTSGTGLTTHSQSKLRKSH